MGRIMTLSADECLVDMEVVGCLHERYSSTRTSYFSVESLIDPLITSYSIVDALRYYTNVIFYVSYTTAWHPTLHLNSKQPIAP